jgi:predicted component of type VI protein secretion system
MIKVQLIVVQGKPEGKTIPLTGPVFRVGRDETCHLRPSSDQVSRQHAEIVVSADSAILKDLGSRNGTHLNGRLVTEPTKLKSGDLIKIGYLTFAVSIQGAPAEAAQPGRPATGPRSLDEVGQEEVESWLIADNSRPVPDRPSGVYDGDTITINAYKGTMPKSDPALAATRSDPAIEKPRSDPAVTTPAATPGAAPPPPAAPAPAPPQPETLPATPAPAVARSDNAPRSYFEELEEIEQLPEGQGDTEPGAYLDDAEANREEDAEASPDEMPDEFIDESNPFYQAKKKSEEPAEATKPAFKDSSEAANAILKKMLDRRRGGR